MDIFQALFLGFVQGITEFIPVSSSGHLELVQHIFNLSPDNFHLFMEFVNFGTLLALLFYYHDKIWRITKNVFTERNYRLAINLVITTIPAGIVGLIFASIIENNSFFSSLYTVSIAMGLVGLLMIFIDKIPHLSPIKNEDHLTPARALAIGLCQIFALVPGVSRSGSTIITGRIVGLDSESAADYSFLASIPIMFGVCFKMFLSESGRVFFAENINSLFFANLIAFVVGLIALKYVLNYLQKPGSLQTFGKYRVILSLIILGVLLTLV